LGEPAEKAIGRKMVAAPPGREALWALTASRVSFTAVWNSGRASTEVTRP
jgi:hypothetical protein